jgi:hypothetical protein
MEIALFRAYELDGLDINSLKENGLTSNLQCPVTVKEELSNYLHCFDKLQRNTDRFLGEIPDVCLYPFPLSINEGGLFSEMLKKKYLNNWGVGECQGCIP